jgi:hypothetical protein
MKRKLRDIRALRGKTLCAGNQLGAFPRYPNGGHYEKTARSFDANRDSGCPAGDDGHESDFRHRQDSMLRERQVYVHY